MKLENVTLDDLGRVKKVIVNKDTTTISEGGGKKKDLQQRIEQIRAQIEKSTSDYDKEKLQERLAKLQGGVAVVKVGATTETELKEKKYRVDDALNATRAAVEEGIVPGGGVALVRCIDDARRAARTRRRREDGRADRPPRARGAHAPDRGERGRRGLRHRRRGPSRGPARSRRTGAGTPRSTSS